MKISRHFTTSGKSVFDLFKWKRAKSVITETDGSVVFEMNGIEVPESWGQLAVDILASKYCRKAGVPCRNQDRSFVDPDGLLGVHEGDDGYLKINSNNQHYLGSERSAKQVVHRLALCWRTHGEKAGYFDSPEDAQAFYDECVYMMLKQMAAPNSPQWFNAGLYEAYGLSGPAQGHYIADHKTGATSVAQNAYENPQVHACFINSIEDTLLREGGIFDFITREARLFKYGSGSGANMSSLRASNEPLSSGGRSSGLMSWLRIADASAGAIKSGGTTRRAAKMVVLDADHPNILDFIRLKAREELKVAAMVEGQRHLTEDEKAYAAKTGLNLTFDFNGEAYQTVTGQNANNSVRLTDDFMHKVVGTDPDNVWNLYRRTDGKVAKTLSATGIMDEIAEAAWRCADPGVQFDTTYNDWHTCPVSGRINATNPCSEYAFLDNTACNLASLNLVKFFNDDDGRRTFDVDGFKHAVSIWTMVLEISVLMASYPAEEIANLSWRFRTLGLGYANLGAMLMRMGLPYDSDAGRAVAGAVTAILTGQSYAYSALLAKEHGPFAGYAENREIMLGVLNNHAQCAGYFWHKASSYPRPVSIAPPSIDHSCLSKLSKSVLENATALSRAAVVTWSDALAYGEQHGYRNAQTTVIAPTGTIGLLMECDTTGVEPDFSVVKFKKLAGGGMMKIVNESVTPALRVLGMTPAQIDDILAYVLGRPTLNVDVDGVSLADRLRQHGVTDTRLAQITSQLVSAYHVKYVIPELKTMGLSDAEIERIDGVLCGAKTLEGAPHLPVDYYAVFDTATAGGTIGKRSISWLGHLRMMAAAQSFVSGSISKTINMPRDATVQDVRRAYIEGWKLGIKAIALYRDGSKRSQPLNSSADANTSTGQSVTELRKQIDMMHQLILGRVADDDVSRVGLTTEAVSFVQDVLSKSARRRRRLSDDAAGIRHKFQVGTVKGYLNVTLYDDGTPGEIFVQCSKAGSTLAGFMDSWAIAVSNMLQYGVPVEVIARKFAFVSFAPHGMTNNPDIRFAKSLVDYIARWLGHRFVAGYAQQPVASEPTTVALPNEHAPTKTKATKTPGVSKSVLAASAVLSDNAVTLIGANALIGDDAPPCDECGMLMVNAGGCFKCQNCGAGGSCG